MAEKIKNYPKTVDFTVVYIGCSGLKGFKIGEKFRAISLTKTGGNTYYIVLDGNGTKYGWENAINFKLLEDIREEKLCILGI